MSKSGSPPVALTIAGSDSGSGAGIQADIRTMAAFGVLATTAVTAVTAQNTTEVRDLHPVPADVVVAQIRAVVDDLPVRAVKTGLLVDASVVEAVGLLAASGYAAPAGRGSGDGCIHRPCPALGPWRGCLSEPAAATHPGGHAQPVRSGPVGRLNTPPIHDVDAMAEAARAIHGLGPTWVLVKGGHLPGVASTDHGVAPDEVVDVLFDGTRITLLRRLARRHAEHPWNGLLAVCGDCRPAGPGTDVPTAVATAKQFVHGALLGAAGWRLGKGHGPIDHLGWSAKAIGTGRWTRPRKWPGRNDPATLLPPNHRILLPELHRVPLRMTGRCGPTLLIAL